MGEVLFHTGLAEKVIDGVERLVRQVPGGWRWRGGRRHGVLRDLRFDHCNDGDARQPDAAVMLSRGYHPTMATGPLMAIGPSTCSFRLPRSQCS